MNDIFEWDRLLFNDLPIVFVAEVAFRTVIMFIVVLLTLKFTGKRGVKQLSVFELVVIISLGSAAGDPMFYKEVGLISAVSVFAVVVLAYKITSYFVNKSKKVEEILEGSSTCLIEEGKFAIDNFKKETLAQDEFFSELRLKSIAHLGQIELAIIETSGSVSVFFYSNDDVKYGLPILPSLFCEKHIEIKQKGYYSCSFCGFTKMLSPVKKSVCDTCGKTEWVKSINTKRIT